MRTWYVVEYIYIPWCRDLDILLLVYTRSKNIGKERVNKAHVCMQDGHNSNIFASRPDGPIETTRKDDNICYEERALHQS